LKLETLAWGYTLVEAPRTDSANHLYFTDALGGGVYRRSPDGRVETLIADRELVGGLALHAEGGFVMSGRSVEHWRDGARRTLLERDGVQSFNDLHPDLEGRVYVGAIRCDLGDLRADKIPGECYRIGTDGTVEELYGGVEVSNGIGLSPDGTTLFQVDSTSKGIIVHDVDADGALSKRRLVGRDSFAKGIPDGLCVDAEGNLWAAHVGGRRVVKLSPSGEELDEIRVPAKAVTSCAFGGPEWSELYIVTADNLEEPGRGGTIFRCKPGVAGTPTPLARV